MSITINATNPMELRQEAERLLREGYPMAPVVVDAITGTDPAVLYLLQCETDGCSSGDTGPGCQPPQTQAGRLAAFTLDGWEQWWLRHGSSGVIVRGWDMDRPMDLQPLSEDEYDNAIDAAQSIGYNLARGEHTSSRGQSFWLSGPCVIVFTSTRERGRVVHTIEPMFERGSTPRAPKTKGKAAGRKRHKRR